jgi:predicted nuclease with TOPRIM domain
MRRANPQIRWLGLSLLGCAAGCTISVQPWTKPVVMQAPDPAANVNPAAGVIPPGMMPPGMPPPGIPRQMPPLGGTNESISHLIRQYNETDDHRKALLEQVQHLTRQVKERDDGLRRATFEMEDSTKQIRRTKDELRQWQGEMDEMRDRMKRLEEERATLKPLIEDILGELERKKETVKFRGGPALK